MTKTGKRKYVRLFYVNSHGDLFIQLTNTAYYEILFNYRINNEIVLTIGTSCIISGVLSKKCNSGIVLTNWEIKNLKLSGD